MFEFVFSSKVKDVISLSKIPDMLDEIERRESHEGEVENMLPNFFSPYIIAQHKKIDFSSSD